MMKRYLAAIGLVLCTAIGAYAQTTSGIGPNFTGVTAGSANTYTLTPSQNGFQLRDQWGIRVKINATNTTASTLNVTGVGGATGAINIYKQNVAGVSALTGGELVANREYELVYSSSASAFVIMNNLAADIASGATSATVSAAEWANAKLYLINTAGQTLTLPVATSLPTNGMIVIQTVGVQATLAPNAADGINGGTINTSVTIPADATVVVTTTGASGTGAFSAPLGPLQYFPLSWYKSVDLSAQAVSFGSVGTPRTIYGIRCRPDVLVGGVATIDVYSVTNGQIPPGAGVKLNTTSCNANTTAGTEQNLGVASASIPAGYWVTAVGTGAGWPSSVGSGAIQMSYR